MSYFSNDFSFLATHCRYIIELFGFSAGMKRNQELQTENEAAAGRLFAMEYSKEDVRGDIQVMRRAAEKADSELTQGCFIALVVDYVFKTIVTKIYEIAPNRQKLKNNVKICS